MIEQIDKSERCPKCKQRTKYAYDIRQTCDYCGKKEFYPKGSSQYWGDFYKVTIFPGDHNIEGTQEVTFCCADHMFRYLIGYRQPFGFMTLPYVQGSKKGEGRKGSLVKADLKRLAAGALKK